MPGKSYSIVLALGAILFITFHHARGAEADFYPLEKLKPGLHGIGKTCFEGSTPEEFQVEILGVLYGTEPGASAVLARLEGGALERVGVFEGMSGSPVYIDGKLLGAIAFTYPYAKEAICGITPISQMVEAFEESAVPKIEFQIDIKADGLSRAGRLLRPGGLSYAGLARNKASNPEEGGKAGRTGHTLVPIATPLSMGGLDAKSLEIFQPQFEALGLSVIRGAAGVAPANESAAGEVKDGDPLVPGSNMVIPLLRGDMEVSAGGTVTYIDGDKIYAFGHSLLDLGFTNLPVHKARTVVIFPSLESSFKILQMGEPAGSIRQDRGMGVYGFLGDAPSMLPLKINLFNSRGGRKQFTYEMVRDRLLTPLLVNLAMYNTIIVSERAQGVVTVDVQGKIKIGNHEDIDVYNRFSSDSGAVEAASASAAIPVNYLMAFGYDELNLERIDLDVTVRENDRSALLDHIRLNRLEAKAGDSLELEISYKKPNGDTIQKTYPLEIPLNVPPGPLNVLVADGTTLMSLDEEEMDDEILIPRDLSHLIQLINNIRKNDRLYVRMFRREPGAVIKGEGLPGLPPSMLSILGSERRQGAVSPIGVSSVQEYELPPSDYIAQGSKMLTVRIKP
jgi:hypothetical protein